MKELDIKHILKILLQKTFCAETYSITLYRKVLRIMWIGAISTIQYQLESRNRFIALNIMDIRTLRILRFNSFFSKYYMYDNCDISIHFLVRILYLSSNHVIHVYEVLCHYTK